MKVLLKALTLIGLFCFSLNAFAQVKRSPDSAFDSERNRYLMVWEEVEGDGTVIKAQFRNPDGSASGSSILISDPRETQGCFYGQFDDQNGDITTPTDCLQNLNPSVAYNNGQYLVAWEVHGNASAPSSSPDNQFINIFAQVVDGQTLDPVPGWEEGILISKVFIAANNAESRCGDRHACNDSQIQAWSKSKNPDVSPQVGGQGFIVTWQTNKDFIGCADSERRGGWAVYGRYIDQNFSATSTTNPPAFAVYKDDSTVADSCEPLSNVDNGTNPRIAVNQTSGDFVIVYEVARASGGNASIGAKRVTLGSDLVGQVSSTLMPDIVASVGGSSLNQPDVVSFKGRYVLFASDGSSIRVKGFESDSISSSEPATLSLGSGSKVNPRASTNLGIGGQRGGGSNSSPERILLAYERGGDIFAATLNEDLGIARAPQNYSSGSSENQLVEISSDVHDFLAVWQGNDSGITVFAEFISSEDSVSPTPTASPTPNVPPSAPGLVTPANSATYAPTRVYLSWDASTDSNGDEVTYNVYFGESTIPATPQVTGLSDTHYIIGPETEADTGITLDPSATYQWKIEADDGQGGLTSSSTRTFNTDNSIAGWWKFDENPAGATCAGGSSGETVCDSSGNNNHAVPTGTPSWLPPPTAGILGGAIDFDAVDDKVQVPNHSTINPNSVSVLAQIRTGGVAGQQMIVDKRQPGAAGPAGYNLRLDGIAFPLNAVFIITESDGTEHTVTANGAVTNAVTHHLIGSFDLGTGATKIFANGGAPIMQNFGALNRATKSSVNLAIGDTSLSSPIRYKGLIGEVILLNRAMSDAEADNAYQASQ